jgi:hypothetical protein
MAIEHLRNLAKYGVISDIDPYDLAPEAFSAGVNVRFRNGKITGAPVFRNVMHLADTNPRFAFAANPAQGLDYLFVGYQDGKVSLVSGAAEFPYTPTSYTSSAVEATWSATSLADVTYVNRSDRAPWALRTSDSKFVDISGLSYATPADKWDPTWSCKLLRTCGGALVALNVQKGATRFPTMVKTSSIPLADSIPVSWDQTTPNTLALENVLADMQGGIVDACSLGSDLIIYGQKQPFRMTPNGQLSEFSFTPLPFQKGSINANCSVELDGTDIVFGPDDIWRHDGNSEKSICDGRVRDYIYSSINMSKANLCFVVHNPKLAEISFCYPSGDGNTAFTGVSGCNRAAVWNYLNDTWSFDDLPSVYGGCTANLSNPLTYDSCTATYDTMGGSYQDLEDGFKRTPCFVGDAQATYSLSTSLYAQDPYGANSSVSYPVDVNATKPKYLARDGIDLDELNADLRGTKVLASIYPQARLGAGAATLQINGGSGDGFNDPAVFVGYQDYDGDTLTKCDFNTAGRFLSVQIRHNDYREMAITGFDLDIRLTGKRG